MSADWLAYVPALNGIDDPAWRKAASGAQGMHVKSGNVLFREGDMCSAYVLVISGTVRVQKTDANGREILLYRVERGQSCMLTTTCLIGGLAYPADGIAETDVDLVVLPTDAFHAALAESAGFRRFVMHAISRRITEMMALIEDVAFARMDARIARLVLQRRRADGTVAITHQALAAELGTAREVVSRVLKDFERRGWLTLSRGSITILQADSLKTLCDIVTDS